MSIKVDIKKKKELERGYHTCVGLKIWKLRARLISYYCYLPELASSPFLVRSVHLFYNWLLCGLTIHNRLCACMGVVRILYLKIHDFPHTHQHFVGQLVSCPDLTREERVW